MFQPSLIARFATLVVGSQLALATSVWAAAPATAPHGDPAKTRTQPATSTIKAAPAKKPLAAVTRQPVKVPVTLAPKFEPTKPSSGKKGQGDNKTFKSTDAGSRVRSANPGHGEGGKAAGGGTGTSAQHHPNGTTTLRGRDGSLTDVWPDGTIHRENRDGSSSTNHADGSTDYYGKDRQQTGHEDADNDPNGQSHSTSSSTSSSTKNRPATEEAAPSSTSNQTSSDQQDDDDV